MVIGWPNCFAPWSITHVTLFMIRAGKSIPETQFEDLLFVRHRQKAGGSKMKSVLIKEPKLQGRVTHRPPSMMEMCCMNNKNMNVQELPYYMYSEQSPEFLNGTHNRHHREAVRAPPLPLQGNSSELCPLHKLDCDHKNCFWVSTVKCFQFYSTFERFH